MGTNLNQNQNPESKGKEIYRHLKKSSIVMSLDDAIQHVYEACKVCEPDEMKQLD